MNGAGKGSVHSLPALESNYIHILTREGTDEAIIVDPGEATPVLDYLAGNSLRLSGILLTHHHADHVGGVEEIRAATHCKVAGARADQHRLPVLDIALMEGDRLDVLGSEARVLAVPGHTLGHIAYHLPEEEMLFTGDTLFLLGCGRLFEGTAQMMWDSLRRLRDLPGGTRIYCGHEYTRQNLAFAITQNPQNEALMRRTQKIARNGKTVPETMQEERRSNPFLRADDPLLAEDMGLPAGTSPLEIFTELRLRKDQF